MASAVEPSSNSGSVDPATVAARHVPDHDVTEKRARAAQTIQVGLYSRYNPARPLTMDLNYRGHIVAIARDGNCMD